MLAYKFLAFREILALVAQPDALPAAPSSAVPQLLLPAPRAHRCTRCGGGAPPTQGLFYADVGPCEMCLACLKVLGIQSDLPELWPPLAGSVARPPTEAKIKEPRLGLCPATAADLQRALSIAQGRMSILLALVRAEEDGLAGDLAATLQDDLAQALHDFGRHQEEICAVCGLEEFWDDHRDEDCGTDDIFVEGGLVPLHAGCVGERTPDGRLCGQCDSCHGYGIGLRVLPGTEWAQCPTCWRDGLAHQLEIAETSDEEEVARA